MLWSELNNINNLNSALHFQAKSKHQASLKVRRDAFRKHPGFEKQHMDNSAIEQNIMNLSY